MAKKDATRKGSEIERQPKGKGAEIPRAPKRRNPHQELQSEIRQYKRSTGLDYPDIALAAGVSSKTLDRFMFHRSNPRPSTIQKLTELIRTPISDGDQGMLFPAGLPTDASREAELDGALLNADRYSDALAQFLSSVNGELTFGIFGRWGRGKTYLMRLVEKALHSRDNEQWAVVRLSAWAYPSTPELWVHMYERIAAELRTQAGWRSPILALRVSVAKSGGWGLVGGLAGLVLALIPLWARLATARWILGFTISVGGSLYIYRAWRAFTGGDARKRARLFSLRDHRERLGIQAVLGDDLRALLTGWTRGAHVTAPERTGWVGVVREHARTFGLWGLPGWTAAALAIMGILVLSPWFHGIAKKGGLPDFGYGLIEQHPEPADDPSGEEPAKSLPDNAAPESELTPGATVEGTIAQSSRNDNSAGIDRGTGRNAPLHQLLNKPQDEVDSRELRLRWWVSTLAVLAATLVAAGLVGHLGPWRRRRVLLIVDDLDRCRPDDLVEIMASIKLMLEDPSIHGRMLAVMLVEEEMLRHSIRFTFRSVLEEWGSKLRGKDAKEGSAQRGFLERRLYRENVEKLLLGHLRLPLLNTMELSEILGGIFHEWELLNATLVEDDEGDNVQTGDGRPRDPNGTQPSDKDDSQSDLEVTLAQELSDVRAILPELANASRELEAGPRSLRAFFVRYQLARLLLSELGANYDPVRLARALIRPEPEALPHTVLSALSATEAAIVAQVR